jgi:ABC-type bacteriocin/lantibiotic exporter with double-glycine peptidase domain
MFMKSKKNKQREKREKNLGTDSESDNAYSVFKSYYYTIIHSLLIFVYGYTLLFNNSIYHLLVLLVIVSLNICAIMLFQDCPITKLEKKYSTNSIVEQRILYLKNNIFMYKGTNRYESQLECVLNFWCLIAGKIFVLMLT